MPADAQDPLPTSMPRLRSGTAARLAGLPVSTLRVWERRYRVVDASKTSNGQRVYSTHDVARLKLLRQLTSAGHTIGIIASLSLESLQMLAASAGLEAGAGIVRARTTEPEPAQGDVVVGRGIASALEAVTDTRLRAVFDDLDEAERAAPDGQATALLVVRLASLQTASVARIRALAGAWGAGATLVVYAFGTEAAASLLRSAGARVHREPLTSHELARLVDEARAAAPEAKAAAPAWPLAPRRFDDDTLARLSAMPSPVACECLRHMSEIVVQLAAFERYSHDCISTGPTDEVLHRQLHRTAGTARTLFEQALQQVIDDERLNVD